MIKPNDPVTKGKMANLQDIVLPKYYLNLSEVVHSDNNQQLMPSNTTYVVTNLVPLLLIPGKIMDLMFIQLSSTPTLLGLEVSNACHMDQPFPLPKSLKLDGPIGPILHPTGPGLNLYSSESIVYSLPTKAQTFMNNSNKRPILLDSSSTTLEQLPSHLDQLHVSRYITVKN